MKEYKVCKRCVMDNSSDETITFDKKGYCNYCNQAINDIGKIYFPNDEGIKRLSTLIKQLKTEGEGKKFDCLMGLSGGLDSSYLAYLGYRWGLRIMAVHVDDGYDTQISKDNIEKLCKKADIKLEVIKPDAEQFNDLIRAFLLAGVPNLAIPQDNILVACLYQFAKENGIKNFLSGGNFALESILEQGNTHDNLDTVNIKDIHKRFGRKPINKMPLYSRFQRDMDRYFYKINTFRPLNFIDYNRERAFKELNEFCGFTYYGSKHLENTFTKFLQVYYLPKKFNVDKRKSHLSSLIVSGQMTREEALDELKKPLYDEKVMNKEIMDILENLDILKAQFDMNMEQKPKQHTDYKTSNYNKNKMTISKMKRELIKK